jgi:hypothetical protein
MRRTPALTRECQQLFEQEVRADGGWQPNGTFPRIAGVTGLTTDQVRDAIFSVSADAWRRSFVATLVQEEKDADS